MKNLIEQRIKESIETKKNLIQETKNIQKATKLIIDSYKKKGKLIVFGNGGSAADAQHIVAELVNKLYIERPMLNAIALTVNTSVLTAIGNDSDYNKIFSRQIENLAERNDIILAISTSGNSKNVIEAIKTAKKKNLKVIGLTGKTGGIMNDLNLDILIKAPSNDVARIQETHITIGHIICELVEKELFSRPKLFINTGGKGTRLGDLTKEIPKPLVKLNNKPIIDHILTWAQKYNIKDFILLNGHLHEKIEDHFKNSNLNIIHSNEPKPLGTGGPIKHTQQFINDTFILIQGDLYPEINLYKMLEFHKKNKATVTLLLHESSHPEDSDVMEINADQTIKNIIHKPGNKDHGNLTNAGLFIIEPKILNYIKEGEKITLEKTLLPRLLNKEKLIGYIDNKGYIKDVGTIDRLQEVTNHIKNKSRAIFLDRDGVIIKEKHLLHKKEDLTIFNQAIEGLKKLQNSNYKKIIITNQPAIGRGLMTEQQYKEIEQHFNNELKQHNIKIEQTYYCPHHPTKGKNQYLKECKCRKPNNELILQAAIDHNIDLEKSYMIGDKRSDIKAGNKAGCKTILVKTGYGGKGGDTELDTKPDHIAENLKQAINLILK